MKPGLWFWWSRRWDTTLDVLSFSPSPVNPGGGQCQVGSLTGAVASKRVTEAFKGWLSADGNRAQSVNAEASLTARPTSRAVTKVGVSDQVVVSGNAIA